MKKLLYVLLLASHILACNLAETVKVEFRNLSGASSVAELPITDGAPALPDQEVLYIGAYHIRLIHDPTGCGAPHPSYTVLFRKPQVEISHSIPYISERQRGPNRIDFYTFGQLSLQVESDSEETCSEDEIENMMSVTSLSSSTPGCRAVLDPVFRELKYGILQADRRGQISELVEKVFKSLEIRSDATIVGFYHQGMTMYPGKSEHDPTHLVGINIRTSLNGIELWVQFRIEFEVMSHVGKDRTSMIDTLASLGNRLATLPGASELDQKRIKQAEMGKIYKDDIFRDAYNADSEVRAFQLEPASLPELPGLVSKCLEDLSTINIGERPLPPYLLPLLAE